MELKMEDNDLGIREYQQIVDQWIQKYGVRYFSEMTNLAILMEEVGELARIFAREYGDQSYKESDKGQEMAQEMADILFVLTCMANQTGVDLAEAARINLENKTERDKNRHWNNRKLTSKKT